MHNRLFLVASLMFAIGCGKNSTTAPSASPPPSPVSVSIVAGSRTLTTNAYSPNPVSISRGMSVMWVNNDTISHSSTSDSGGWDSGLLTAGQSFTMNFPNAGTFTYHCSIHRGMVGTVNVQ